ncbi:hypothetical protein OAA15_00795 [bacterium]|nr:hypothetical protein [bacterium]
MSIKIEWNISNKQAERGKVFGMNRHNLNDMVNNTGIGVNSVLKILEKAREKGYIESKPINDDTNFYGTFDASGYEDELAECTGIDVETLENLKGARIQILCDATGDDEYFDIVFLNYYDGEEQPLVINALSKEHITFE